MLANSSFVAQTNPITIRSGESIEAGDLIKQSDGRLKIEYKYNDDVVATYTIPEFYTIFEGDEDEIISVNNSSNLTIQPKATFYACKVTMGDINSDIVIRNGYSGEFIVEFNTTVTFSFSQTNGVFTYTYTFSSGQEITYTMKESKYAMQYVLNEQTGDR